MFSVVSAVYNVHRYLDEFIASLETQKFDHAQFEVIAVDDGSTDDSLARLKRWAAESAIAVTVLTQENGGQSSARNLGLGHARGQWVTFLDPDDTVAANYLTRVARFLSANPDCDMIATHRIMHLEADGTKVNSHPLRKMFREGDVLRDLSVDVDSFHGSAPASFFRRAQLEQIALRFDPAVRPNFEDGHFCSRYLLQHASPKVGFLRSAKYFYRKRADSSSTLQTGLLDPDRYTAVLERGYLGLLEQAAERWGTPPEWLQHFIVYELSYYFSTHDNSGVTVAGQPAIAGQFHGLMARIAAHLDPELIADFGSRPLKREWRLALLAGYRDEPWRQDAVEVGEVDEDQQLVRLSYYFTGSAPDAELVTRGKAQKPPHSKIRAVVYHGRHLLSELVLWAPTDVPLRVHIDGHAVRLRFMGESDGRYMWQPFELEYAVARRRAVAELKGPPPAVEELVRIAQSRRNRRRYAGAWVFMDRVHDADDSGEHLFRWVRDNKPDVNAWFVVERGTRDWERLRKSSYSKRLVAHGSDEWKSLMLNARHLISSHADKAVIAPEELAGIEPPWRVTFLQHGVIKDDLSTWLNPKPIQVFVTSTQQEYASIAGDNTTYQFTSRETVLTGLPRFDALWNVGQRTPPEQRDLLLVAPTWRNWLVPPLNKGTQRRDDYGPEFFESEFLQRWMELLKAPEIKDLCERHGLALGFLPHPNLQQALPDMDLPAHVVPQSYDQDVRKLFARSRVLVTDYSSVAFNAAYIDRPVVYFQFDRDRVLGGDHVGVGGYFDYERDGFGPVAEVGDDALALIGQAVDSGPGPKDAYQRRIDATFPVRDGRCCERAYDAIVASTAYGGQPTPGVSSGA